MSRALLNIWIRDEKCTILQNVWKLDLKIKTCSGAYLHTIDPDIVEQLSVLFPSPEFTISIGIDHVSIFCSNHNKSLNHIELSVPPGCYKISARVCFNRNEDTSEFLAIAKCGDHVCVNLILPEIMNCGKAYIHPAVIAALPKNPPREQVKEFVRLNLLVFNPEQFNLYMLRTEAVDRAVEYQATGLTEKQQYLDEFVAIIDEMVANP